MQHYGTRLKSARRAKGLTQVQLAKMLGISQTSYQRMETGEHDMKMSNILKICETLDVSADWLIGTKAAGKQLRDTQTKHVGEMIVIDLNK